MNNFKSNLVKRWKNCPSWVKGGIISLGGALFLSLLWIGSCFFNSDVWFFLPCFAPDLILSFVPNVPFFYFFPDLFSFLRDHNFIFLVLGSSVWFLLGSILGYIHGKVMPFFRKRIKPSTREIIWGWIGLVIIIFIIWFIIDPMFWTPLFFTR